MKNLQDFLILARKKYLQARSLDYYLQTDEAQSIIKKATPEQQEALYGLLQRGDREGFCSLLDKIRDSDIETMSVMVLRRTARHLGVLDYHILSKEQLLTYIKMRRDKNARAILANERRDSEAAGPAGKTDGDGQ